MEADRPILCTIASWREIAPARKTYSFEQIAISRQKYSLLVPKDRMHSRRNYTKAYYFVTFLLSCLKEMEKKWLNEWQRGHRFINNKRQPGVQSQRLVSCFFVDYIHIYVECGQADPLMDKIPSSRLSHYIIYIGTRIAVVSSWERWTGCCYLSDLIEADEAQQRDVSFLRATRNAIRVNL